ncbi:hypothetical protein [Bradyrhizobium sp. CCBAU 11430]|uniref:hypothetical protein n=1 Tax=Bradyrhizobium sp. CCBAU 11430 TaxID=1630881 RepID=UPI002306C136|nr:hypothetical protein [Bradyrhizobium sp. CCBAU 11430]
MYVADRKSDRDPVNETKPALFSVARDDRFVGQSATETFAMVTDYLMALRARRQVKSSQSALEAA